MNDTTPHQVMMKTGKGGESEEIIMSRLKMQDSDSFLVIDVGEMVVPDAKQTHVYIQEECSWNCVWREIR